jgi:hypothetical protein
VNSVATAQNARRYSIGACLCRTVAEQATTIGSTIATHREMCSLRNIQTSRSQGFVY